MRLFLLRHAEAEPTVTSDEARTLTPRGIAQAAQAGDFFRRHGLRPDLVLASPYRRTIQTAEILAEALQRVPVEPAGFLASGMEPGTALEALHEYSSRSSVLLVGHQPDLSLLTAALVGVRDPGNFPFQLATLAALRVDRFAVYGASLEFFLPLALMLPHA